MGVFRYSRTGAAVLVAALVLGVFWVPPTVAAGPPWTVAGGVLAAIAGAAMLLGRRWPFGATVVAGVATVAGNALGVSEDPMLATAWCLYPLAVARAVRTRRVVLIFAVLLALLTAVTAVPGDAGGMGQRLVVAVAALSVTWLLGTTVGRQIATAREAERSRVHLEVARDVHDVVGHALGVISAEAGVTRGLADAGADELRDSLAGIEKQARQALEEIQGLVRGLRSEPNLARLLAATRAAGVDVVARIELAGQRQDAVLYRIVQESLTNVVRHAPGSSCTVDVTCGGGAVVVQVRDRGPGAPADRADGFGLTGMRERARLVGGEVTWGNHAEGGFEVRARLPVRESK